MPYIAPYIDSSGLHLPTYQDILDDMVAGMKAIYGNEVYLGNDDKDYQLLSIFARKVYDCNLAIDLAYRNRSPVRATYTGLDSIVKLNGLRRKSASYSTIELTLTGTEGTVVSNGVVQDTAGSKWNLPASVTIGGGGTVSVTATSQIIGAVTATAGTVTKILTPTRGWVSVTNSTHAVAGQPVERDSALRARQALSVAYPGHTMLDGTIAGIAAVTNVARFRVYENYTNAPETDPNGLGLPAHSITCVVEGGTDSAVAQAIYLNKGPGCYTNGDQEVDVTSALYDTTTTIRFYRPTYVPIYTTLDIVPMAGWTTATSDSVKEAVVAYLNALEIYEVVTISGLYGAALSVIPNLARPTFSIQGVTAGKTLMGQAAEDVALDFDEVAEGDLAKVEITLPS